MLNDDTPFWRTKRLEEMSHDEWEALCDGCARCCLVKLEFEDTGELALTMAACRQLDLESCRCDCYDDREGRVEDCLVLTPETLGAINWLPSSCAYRVIARGEELPSWHPLITGDPSLVHSAGISIRGRALSESQISIDDLEDYILEILESE